MSSLSYDGASGEPDVLQELGGGVRRLFQRSTR